MGRASNCVGAWSYLRRAGTPRSLLSPPGEALWPSGPMDHGVQRRERGGGQAAGPAARPELAAPSAAAVPREIPTCSASLLFRLSGRKPPPATGSSFARLLRCVQCPAGQRLCSSRATVLSPHYPQYGAIITTSATLSLLTLLSLSSRGGPDWGRTRPPTHCHAALGFPVCGGVPARGWAMSRGAVRRSLAVPEVQAAAAVRGDQDAATQDSGTVRPFRGLNRVTRRVAPWMPGFGVVAHAGRRSGRRLPDAGQCVPGRGRLSSCPDLWPGQ